MTALTGPFLVNDSTGSDTASSGIGPSTAVSFTGLIDASGSPTEVTTNDSVSGISAGHVLYADTISSGRKFNIVASVSTTFGTTTITCDFDWGANFNGTVVCGGKRDTLGGLADAFNTTNGFDCEVSLETDVTMNATATCGSTRQVKVYSSESKTRRKITTDQQYPFSGGNWNFTDLTFHSTFSGSDGRLFQTAGAVGNASVVAENCIFGDVSNTNNFNQLINGVSSTSALLVNMPFAAIGCLFINFDLAVGGCFKPRFVNCHFKDMPHVHRGRFNGIDYDIQVQGDFTGCFFENCTRIDDATDGRYVSFYGCIFDGITGTSGGFIAAAGFNYDNGKECSKFAGNLLTNCAVVSDELEGDLNFLYNTTTGIAGLANSVTLGADPYVNRSGGDFDFTADASSRFEFDSGQRKYKLFAQHHAGGGGFTKVGLNGGIDG